MNWFLGIDATRRARRRLRGHRDRRSTIPCPGTTAIAADGVWHHAAATYDGTTWRLYLDGKLEAKRTSARHAESRLASSTPASARRSTPTGAAAGFFDGELDEVRIWNVARTGAQIRANKDSEVPDAHERSARPVGISNRRRGDDGRRQLRQRRDRHARPARPGSPATASPRTRPLPPTLPVSTHGGDARSASPGTPTPSRTSPATTSTVDDSPGSDRRHAVNGIDLDHGTRRYTDTGLTRQQYYYAVVAVDGANNRSGASTRRSATPQAGDPVLRGRGGHRRLPLDAGTATAALVAGIPGTSSRSATTFTRTGPRPSSRTATTRPGGPSRRAPARRRATTTTERHRQRDAGYFDYFNGVGMPDRPGRRPRSRLLQLQHRRGEHLAHRRAEQRVRARHRLWLPGGCAAGSAQEQWLETTSPTAPTNNIIAMWHKPRLLVVAGNCSHLQRALAGAVRRRCGHRARRSLAQLRAPGARERERARGR